MKKILYLLIFFGLLSIVWAATPSWKSGQCVKISGSSSYVKATDTITASGEYVFSDYLFDSSVLSGQLVCKSVDDAYYRINYKSNDGTNKTIQSEDLPYGVSSPLPKEVFTRTGYTIDSWNDKSDYTGNSYSSSITGNCGSQRCTINLYAHWKKLGYNVTLKYMDGVTSDSNVTVSVNDLPTPTRTAYTFNGWYTGSEGIESSLFTKNDFISDSTYKWTYNSSTGAWESTGNKGINSSVSVLKTVEFNAKAGEQLSFEWRSNAESSYDYAAWNIWDVNNSKWLSGASTWGTSYSNSTSGLKPTSGLETTKGKQSSSVYTTNTYTFKTDGTYQIYWTYRKDSSDNKGTDLAYVRNVNVLKPKLTLNETPVNELSDGLTLYAKWTPINYTITYNLNGGTGVNNGTYTIETKTFNLPKPTKAGYSFAGWYETENFSGSKVTSIVEGSTGNKVFYAKWGYSIKLKYMDNVTADANAIALTVNELPTPARTGYTFNGWYPGLKRTGNGVLAKDDFISDSTYKWTYNPSTDGTGAWESTGNKGINSSVSVLKTVEFNAKAGEQLSFEWRSYGEKNYDYAAWNIWDVNNSKWLSGASTWGTTFSDSTSGLTPTSGLATTKGEQSSSVYTTNTYTFTADGTYQIYWVYRKDASGYIGTDLAYVRNVNVPGQTIVGPSETPVRELSDGLTLCAKWTPINYKITYNLNGGTGVNNGTYSAETKTFSLPKPAKAGYGFKGWYESSDFSGSPVTEIIKGSTGNKIFYAKWGDATYKLKTGQAFNALIPSTTTSVIFTDKAMPSSATLIDVDADGDGGVVAWLDGTTFKVSTQKSGQKVIFNEDSSYMFCGDSNNGNRTTVTQNLTNIDFTNVDTSNVTNMSSMFQRAGYMATTFKLNLSNWNTSNVTNMSLMFYYAGYNAKSWSIGDLSNWDTSKVTSMAYMFCCTGQNETSWSIGNIGRWNTSKVTNMSGMFDSAGYSTTTFSLDLSSWNVSSVTDMSYMFDHAGYMATTFKLNLSNWNTSNVTSMENMFNYAGYPEATSWSVGNIPNWNTSSVTNMSRMFYRAGYYATYSLNLSGWNVNKVTSHEDFNAYVIGRITAPKWVK